MHPEGECLTHKQAHACKRCLGWQLMAIDEAMLALRYEIDGLKAALDMLEDNETP